MKKVLSLVLAFAMIFCLAACGNNSGQQSGGQQQQEPPKGPEYVGLELNFKNKTGQTITGLYLYEAGSTEKGNSICLAQWPDKNADGDLYEFYAYLYRDASIEKYDLYVEFADGTNATWPGLTLANYDKLSLKGGVDPAGWEQEPADDAKDKAAMDELKAIGKATDGYYPGYQLIKLELKNKTSKKGTAHTIKALYIYAKGAADKGANLFANVYPNGMEEGAEYVFGYIVREAAENYCIEAVFDDNSSIVYEGNEFCKPDGDGRLANEISVQSETDPDVWKVQYDDGEVCQQLLSKAVAYGISYVNEDAPEEFPSLDSFVPSITVK